MSSEYRWSWSSARLRGIYEGFGETHRGGLMTQRTEIIARSLDLALDLLRKTRPNNLQSSMHIVAGLDNSALPANCLDVLAEHVANCGPNDRMLHSLKSAIQAWD